MGAQFLMGAEPQPPPQQPARKEKNRKDDACFYKVSEEEKVPNTMYPVHFLMWVAGKHLFFDIKICAIKNIVFDRL